MGIYGPQVTSAPAGAIILNPGDNISTIVNAAPVGATFYFEPGVYRGVSLAPKDGQTFIGAEGAVLNGSAVLTNWTQSGNLWVIGGQTQQGPVNPSAEFLPTTQRPGHPDTVFLDNTPLTPVDSLAKVVPGTFYFDYAADKIYIADNPAGHTVEAGKLTDAFHGNATNVTVQNLVIEKYDPEIQNGAINANQSWTVQNNEVRLNYAVGITVRDGSQVIGNYVHDNGEMGVGGDGNNVLVQGNELASNGFWSGIDPLWEAGGLKFAQTSNLVVRGNYSHDNNGSGLWGDIDSNNTLYEDNVVVHNTINGISYEISYNAIIRNNTLIGNGYGDTRGWGWGAEINIQNSQNVQVYGNRVDMTGGGNGIVLIQQNRGSGAYGFYTTTGNQIHDNIIVDHDGHGAIGGFADYNQSGMLNGGNTWTNNQYFMSDGASRFQWGGSKNFAQFEAAAHETGTISQSYPDTSGWLAGDTGGVAPVVTETLVSDTGTSPVDRITSNPALTGTADANSIIKFTIDGVATSQTATVNAGGVWTFTPSGLSDGQHTIVASETNATGVIGSASLGFTLDRTAPAVGSIAASGSGITAGSGVLGVGIVVTLTVNMSEAVTVTGTPTLTLNDGGAATYTGGSGTTALTFSYTVANGHNTADLAVNSFNLGGGSVVDAAGNIANLANAANYNPPGTLQISTTTAAPALTEALASDTGSSHVDKITSNPALTGTADANAIVHFTVDGTAIAATATANASGVWSYTPTLIDGQHTIVASETNSSGITGTASLSFTLDTQAPVSTITGESLVGSKGGKVNLTGTTGEAGDVISIYDGNTLLGTTKTDSGGAWTFTTGTVSNSVHTYTATATDSAGNVGARSNEAVLGSSKADTLVGTPGNDVIMGHGGSDKITGGGGADTLTGGPGRVTFLYNAVTDSTPAHSDTITDFRHGYDKFDFSNIAGGNASGGISQFQGNITGSGNLTLNPHSVAFVEVSGHTEVLANVSSAPETVTTTDFHAADMKIDLLGVHLGLTASDFHL